MEEKKREGSSNISLNTYKFNMICLAKPRLLTFFTIIGKTVKYRIFTSRIFSFIKKLSTIKLKNIQE